jgi:hypothetical protein
MKKLTFYLGSLLMTFGFCWIPYKSNSQEIQLSRQEQKEARKAALYANFQAIDTLLEKKTFVLEADYLQNQYGSPIPVASNLNFIRLEAPKAVIQTGSNFSMGYNGVGGVTAEGNLDRYKIIKDLKHLSYTVTFTVMTDIGVYDVQMMIGANNSTRATITGLTRGSLTYQGRIVALYNSSVYKGQKTY